MHNTAQSFFSSKISLILRKYINETCNKVYRDKHIFLNKMFILRLQINALVKRCIKALRIGKLFKTNFTPYHFLKLNSID